MDDLTRRRLRLADGQEILFVNVKKTWPGKGGTVAQQESAGLGNWVLHEGRAGNVAVVAAWLHDDVVAAWKVDDPVEVEKSQRGTRYRFSRSERLSVADAAAVRALLPEDYRMYSSVKYV